MTPTVKITKRTTIGVLMGGLSNERDISLRSGRAIAKALAAKGYRVVRVDVRRSLPAQLVARRVRVAFNALHGKWGEDGCVQGLLEVMGIPYTGSGVTASALCMDKAASKRVFAAAGLHTPSFTEVRVPARGKTKALEAIRSPFGFPVVVKPADEGSSVGTAIVGKKKELQPALRAAARVSDHILLEKFVRGRELSVALLDGAALGTVEIKTRRPFYDYKAKYTKGETRYLVPAPIDPVVARRLMDEAGRAYRLTGCEGVARVDFMLAEATEGEILEINTLPGMTELSLVPQIAAAAGLPFAELCERILLGARLKTRGGATR